MKSEVLLAILLKAVDAKLKGFHQPVVVRGARGQRGARGADGKDFNIEEHSATIQTWAREFALKFSDLTSEEVESLRGPRGRDGTDGKDFNWNEHEETIRKWAHDFALKFALKFEDLTSAQIDSLRGPRGRDGKEGPRGKDFVLAEHEENFKTWAKEFALKFEDLTDEQILSLRGPAGRNGKDGRDGKDFDFWDHEEDFKDFAKDARLKFEELTAEQKDELRGARGRDGRDFEFESSRESITEVISSLMNGMRDSLKLQFSDLSAEDIEKIRGPRGRDGRDGKDFDFEASRDSITEVVSSLVSSIQDSLKIRFTDLSAEDIETLRGPRGRDGRDGKDFKFSDHEEFFLSLKPKFSDFSEEDKEQLKLRFSHLTEEEKDKLKLRFSDLTDDDLARLRGARGQRGKPGRDGADGKDGTNGADGKDGKSIRGLPGPVGVAGKNGRDGTDGIDGKDAPRVVDINIDSDKRGNIEFVFEFSDGEILRTDPVKIPGPNVYVSGGVRSSSSSGGVDTDTVRGARRKVTALAGVYDGVNTTYTLPDEPLSADELDVWLQGAYRVDYSFSVDQVVFSGQDTRDQVFDAGYRYGLTTNTSLAKKVSGIVGIFAGGDTTYTLPDEPLSEDELDAYLTGVLRADYTLSGSDVIFIGQDTSDEIMDAKYRYVGV